MGPDRMGLAGRIRRAQYASVCASIWGAHGTKVAFVGWWWVHKGRHGTVSPALLRAGLPGQPPWPILRIGLRCERFSNVQDWLQCAGRIVRGLASPAGRARQVRPPEPEPPRHRETSRLAKIGEEDGRHCSEAVGGLASGKGSAIALLCRFYATLRVAPIFGGRCVGGGYWIRARALRGE